MDLAVITGGDWNALALETDPGLAVALAVVGVEAAAEGGAFWLATMTWPKILEAEVAGLP